MSVILTVLAVLWLLFGYLTGRILVAMDDDGPVPTSWLRKTGTFLTGLLFCWLVLAVVASAVLLIAEERQAAGSAAQGDGA